MVGALHKKLMAPNVVGRLVGSPPRKVLLRRSGSSVFGVGDLSDSLELLGGL